MPTPEQELLDLLTGEQSITSGVDTPLAPTVLSSPDRKVDNESAASGKIPNTVETSPVESGQKSPLSQEDELLKLLDDIPQQSYTPEVSPLQGPQPVETGPQPVETGPKYEGVMSEIGKAVTSGMTDLVQSISELPQDIGLTDKPALDYLGLSAKVKPEDRPATALGNFGSAMVQFLVPFSAASKALKGVSIASKFIRGKNTAAYLKTIAAGGIADFVAFSPNDQNLSATIQSIPATQQIPVLNAITEYLSSDNDDPAAMTRLKNVIEGAGLGLAFDGILKGLSRGVSATSTNVNKVLSANQTYVKARNAVQQMARDKIDDFVATVGDATVGFRRLQNEADRLLPKNAKQYDRLFLDLQEEATFMRQSQPFVEDFFAKGTAIIVDDPKLGTYVKRTGEGLIPILDDIDTVASFKGHEVIKDWENLLKYSDARSATKSTGIPNDEITKFFDDFRAKDHEIYWTDKNGVKHSGKYNEVIASFKNRYMSFNQRFLDFQQSEGILNNATRAKFNRDHTYLNRIVEGLEERYANRIRTTAPGKFPDSVHKSRKSIPEGEGPEIKNILENIITGHTVGIEHALRNRVRRKNVELVEMIRSKYGDETADVWLSATDKKTIAKTYSIADMRKIVKRSKGVKLTVDSEKAAKYAQENAITDANELVKIIENDMVTSFTRKIDMKDNTFIVYRNGKAEFWDVNDKFLARAMRTTSPEFWDDSLKWLKVASGISKRILTRGVTWSPDFSIANLFKDTVVASMLSRSGFRPIIDTLKGLARTTRIMPKIDDAVGGLKSKLSGTKPFNPKGPLVSKQIQHIDRFDEYLENLGGFGSHTYGSSSLPESTYKDYLKKVNDNMLSQYKGVKPLKVVRGDTVWNQFGKGIDWLDDKFARMEYASRVEEFSRLRDQGYGAAKAAMISKDLTIDFSKHGDARWVKTLTAGVPFLNAHIQGLGRTLKAFGLSSIADGKLSKFQREEVVRTWQKAYSMTVIGGVLAPLWHYNNEDPEIQNIYKDLPSHVKNNNFVMVVPTKAGGYAVTMLPKPFEFSIMTNIAESMLKNKYDEREKNAIAEYLLNTLATSTRTSDISLIPQIVRAPIEALALNRKFTGAPVESRSFDIRHTIPRDRYHANTSDTAMFLSRNAGLSNIGISPLQTEHILNGFFGTIGQYVLELITDPLLSSMVDKPVEPAKRADQLPVVKRFVKQSPIRQTDLADDLYRRLETAEGAAAHYMKVMGQLNGIEQSDWNRIQKDPAQKAEFEMWNEMYPVLKATVGAIAELNTLIKYNNMIQPERLSGEDASLAAEKKLRIENELQTQKIQLLREINNIFMDRWRQMKEESLGDRKKFADGGLVSESDMYKDYEFGKRPDKGWWPESRQGNLDDVEVPILPSPEYAPEASDLRLSKRGEPQYTREKYLGDDYKLPGYRLYKKIENHILENDEFLKKQTVESIMESMKDTNAGGSFQRIKDAMDKKRLSEEKQLKIMKKALIRVYMESTKSRGIKM